jgi:hypothetical protein
MIAVPTRIAAMIAATVLAAGAPAAAQTEAAPEPGDSAPSSTLEERVGAEIEPLVGDPSEVVEASAAADATARALELPQASDPVDFSVAPAESAMDHWWTQNPWHYDMESLFPLTRGLEESGLPGGAQPVAMVLTIPLDIAQAPLGLIAGLFGP